MYRFPEGLYSDIRIEHTEDAVYSVQNGEVMSDSEAGVAGAIIRVYDGKMWYTSVTNDLDAIQSELDDLAALAEPDPGIGNDPMVKLLEVNRDSVMLFEGENDIRKFTRPHRKELVNGYIRECFDGSVPEIRNWGVTYYQEHHIKEFYSSKGAEIKQDYQQALVWNWFDIVVNDTTTSGGRGFQSMELKDITGGYDEVRRRISRVLDFARNAEDVKPGDYVCVLDPAVTGMFTHESFGHKSEADFMLNDKTLRDEWVLGKKVGSDLVSISDSGSPMHRGYIAYDDEGTRVRETWLIKNGVLTGRLHDAKSASVLGEELTGNSRAQDFSFVPLVRMTNTYMMPGDSSPEEIIAGVKDGIYIYNVNYGTGQGTFTLQPNICYRIRDGKLAGPLRVNVVTGSVFQALFDIDAVGNDFEICDTSTCGKGGQSMPVSDSGPTIRVKSLNVN
ncbi:MAG: TldD/PmbA family protein [Ruminococcus sp.]|nr:TldD/PmbA family protein [Ruminococcus sp.]